MRWALWIGNDVRDDRDLAPISSPLRLAILDWTAFFYEHYGDDWDEDSNAVEYNRRGRLLAGQLADELGPTYRVQVAVHHSSVDEHGWEQSP